MYLLEDFEYYTLGGDEILTDGTRQSRGSMDYDIRAKNSLTGFQVGGDLWTCIVPGISFGGELKAGVYGNYSQQGTHIVATTTDPVYTNVLDESDSGGIASFVGEGTISLVYRTSPNWSLRGGYNFLYLDGVALAPENFNASVPFSTARTAPGVHNTGNTFYHGFTAGLEWMW